MVVGTVASVFFTQTVHARIVDAATRTPVSADAIADYLDSRGWARIDDPDTWATPSAAWKADLVGDRFTVSDTHRPWYHGTLPTDASWRSAAAAQGIVALVTGPWPTWDAYASADPEDTRRRARIILAPIATDAASP